MYSLACVMVLKMVLKTISFIDATISGYVIRMSWENLDLLVHDQIVIVKSFKMSLNLTVHFQIICNLSLSVRENFPK